MVLVYSNTDSFISGSDTDDSFRYSEGIRPYFSLKFLLKYLAEVYPVRYAISEILNSGLFLSQKAAFLSLMFDIKSEGVCPVIAFSL